MSSPLHKSLLLCFLLIGSHLSLTIDSKEANVKKEKTALCKRDVVVEAREGEAIDLKSELDSSSELHLQDCFVLFTQRASECQSCYGARQNCEVVKNNKSKNKQCPYDRQHEVLKDEDSSGFRLTIHNLGKEDAGFYQFFQGQGAQVQACHVFVEAKEVDPWKMTSLIISAFLILALLVLYKIVSAKEASSLPDPNIYDNKPCFAVIQIKIHQILAANEL